jgi:hypothetical protein
MITIYKIVTKLCHLPYSTFLIETIMSPFSNSLIISRKASGIQIMRLSPIFEILALNVNSSFTIFAIPLHYILVYSAIYSNLYMRL